MRYPILLAGFFLFAAACAAPELRPAEDALRVAHTRSAAASTVAGIRVEVDGGGWKGFPPSLNVVVPVRVTLQNAGAVPLRVQLQELSLVSPDGPRFAALPPMEIRGSELAVVPGDLGGYGGSGLQFTPGFHHDQFYVAPHYRNRYSGLHSWGGAFPFNAGRIYSSFQRWPVTLPTRDMVEKALPDGVLQPGGSLSGMVYFEDVPKGVARVVFRMNLLDARTGAPLGVVEIPFVPVAA